MNNWEAAKSKKLGQKSVLILLLSYNCLELCGAEKYIVKYRVQFLAHFD